MTANRQFNFICAAAVSSAFAATLISAPVWAQEAAQSTTISSSAPAATTDAAKTSDQIIGWFRVEGSLSDFPHFVMSLELQDFVQG